MSQNGQSSTTLIDPDRNQDEKNSCLPAALFDKMMGRVQVGKEGVSAFPPHLQPFYRLIPLCLWLSFKQPQILYFVCCCVLQYFKFCQIAGEIFDASIEVFLLVLCLLLDMLARYNTYEQYTENSSEENVYYSVWKRERQQWQDVQFSELKTGQIIKVEKYLESNRKLNPVNLLPIAFASASNHILVNTTRIDKRQEYRKIKIIKPLRKLSSKSENNQIQFEDKLFQVELNYRFRSNLGSTFEAELSIAGEEDSRVMVSNADIIPRGIPISTEEYVIGIVLMYTDHFQIKSMSNVYVKTNQINDILDNYLLCTLVLNGLLLIVIFIVNLILTQVTTVFDPSKLGEYIYCFLVNIAAALINTVYIGMYLMIHIHRIIDRRELDKQYKMLMKNRVKSIDELAQTNTLIMDDYFFLELPFDSDRFQYAINRDALLNEEHLSLILKVIDESPMLKEHMLGHTRPITKYFRFKKIPRAGRRKIKILKERFIDDNCVEISIVIIADGEEKMFLLRFNDQPVKSTLRNLQDSTFKNTASRLISQYEDTGALMFFIEIMKLSNLESSSRKFNLYGVMTFTEELNRGALQLITNESILKKYNMVMMSSKTWKYINYFMERGGLKDTETTIIMLEEKQECEMSEILKNHIKRLHRQQQTAKSNNKKGPCALLFLNSSMITHLSRHNVRKSLCLLTELCRYVVFYGCSQYEKQICAANLFKIFPQHIYMSNYICDYNIFQWSKLSICERGASSEMLVTGVVQHYRDLKVLACNEAVKSIQNMYCIINSHNFKNQFLISCRVVGFFLVYQGSSIQMGINYTSELFFFYNFVFTVIPIVFMILKRPGVYIDEDVIQYLNVVDMIMINIKTILLGTIITLMIFALVQEEFVTNFFTVVLINCVVTSNLFLLFLDDSYNKTGQVVAIAIQIFIALLVIVLVQLFNSDFFLFVEVGTNFDDDNVLFFITTFVLAPVISFLILFAFSAGREIKIVENQQGIGLRDWEERMGSAEIFSEQRDTEIVLKVARSSGKQMNFISED